eukprot:scaffold269090_cov41-Tisochrysis_lutea.AAC.2
MISGVCVRARAELSDCEARGAQSCKCKVSQMTNEESAWALLTALLLPARAHAPFFSVAAPAFSLLAVVGGAWRDAARCSSLRRRCGVALR